MFLVYLLSCHLKTKNLKLSLWGETIPNGYCTLITGKPSKSLSLNSGTNQVTGQRNVDYDFLISARVNSTHFNSARSITTKAWYYRIFLIPRVQARLGSWLWLRYPPIGNKEESWE